MRQDGYLQGPLTLILLRGTILNFMQFLQNTKRTSPPTQVQQCG